MHSACHFVSFHKSRFNISERHRKNLKGLVKSLRYCGLSQIECHTRNLAQIALFQVLTTPAPNTQCHDGERAQEEPHPGAQLPNHGELAQCLDEDPDHHQGHQHLGVSSTSSSIADRTRTTRSMRSTRSVNTEASFEMLSTSSPSVRSQASTHQGQELITDAILRMVWAAGPVRAWRDNKTLHMPEARGELSQAVLEVPQAPQCSMQDIHVVPGSALPQHQPDRDGGRVGPSIDGDNYNTEELYVQTEHTGNTTSGGGPTTLSSQEDQPAGDEPLQGRGEVQHLREDSEGRADGGRPKEGDGETAGSQEGTRADLRGVSRMETTRCSGTSRNLDRVPVESLDGDTTDVINAVGFKEKGMKQILRQATSALTESETMWKELITQLEDGQQMTGQQVFEQFAVQIFDPNDPSKVINKRPLQRLASLMGVTKKQARNGS